MPTSSEGAKHERLRARSDEPSWREGRSSPSRRRALEVGAAIAVSWVPLAAAIIHAARQAWAPVADNALIQVHALDIPSHIPLVGVYSRFGFYHPGPILFFVNTLPVHVLGPKGLLLATAGVNAMALAGLAIMFDRRGGRVGLVAGTVVSLLLCRAIADQLLDPWNPWITTLPFAFFLVAVWSVLCRDWRLLPWAALAGTFLVQAHVGLLLLVTAGLGAAFGAAIVTKVRDRRRVGEATAPRGPSWTVLAIAVVLLAVLWAPPIIDQLTQHPGNVTRLLDHLRQPEAPPAGLSQAGDVFLHGLGTSAPWLTGDEPVEPYSDRVLGAAWWTLMPTAIACAAGIVVATRRRRASRRGDDSNDADRATDALRFQIVALVAAGVGLVSAARVNGDIYPYLVRWMWPIGAFVWLSAGWSIVVGVVPARKPVAARIDPSAASTTDADADAASGVGPSPAWHRVLLPAGIVVVAVAGIVATVAAVRAPLPGQEDAIATLNVVNVAFDQLASSGTIELKHEGQDLAEIPMGVYAELQRRGLPIYVGPDDSFVLGDVHTLGDRHADVVLNVTTKESAAFHLMLGETPIAYYDLLNADERAEFDALHKRGAVEYVELTENKPLSDPLTPAEYTRLVDLGHRNIRVALFLTPAP